MNRFFFSGAILLALVAPATAADLSSRYPIKAAAAPVFSWTGFYIGANAGFNFGRSKTTLAGDELALTVPVGPIPREANLKPEGFLGGGQVGYNYQIGSVVFGVEADISKAAGSDSFDHTFRVGATHLTTTLQQEFDWFATVRGRIGYSLSPQVLAYGTGGFAAGGVKNSLLLSTGMTSLAYSSNETATGWTVGAGLEYALTNNFTVKAEYLYYDLGDTHVAGPAGGVVLDYKFANTGSIVRTGLNYKF